MTDILSHITFILADGETPSNPFGSTWLLMGLMVVVFYFLLIRPQQKQRKEQQARVDSMKVGDRVVTTAGIHAIVHRIKSKTVTLKVAEGTMIEFDKQAIISVHSKNKKSADSANKPAEADEADDSSEPEEEEK